MLQVHNLSKSYGITTVLAGINLIVNDGEHVGLIGPNGAGKSTLLRCIIGQEQPDIPQILSAYERQRLGRATRVQKEARANGRIYHAGALVAFGRDKVMRHLGPEGMTRRYDWLYNFRTPE